MSTAAIIAPLTASLTLNVSVEQAFRVFTRDIGSWWPLDCHVGEADVAEVILQPRVGGRWYERGVDGIECDWGRVLAWEPPHRVLLTWQINSAWEFDPSPSRASEIEAVFTANEPEQTTVTVEHRHFDRLVSGYPPRYDRR